MLNTHARLLTDRDDRSKRCSVENSDKEFREVQRRSTEISADSNGKFLEDPPGRVNSSIKGARFIYKRWRRARR